MKRFALFCSFAVVLTTVLTTLGLAKPGTPNVLFIMADDLNTALSGYGHPQCKTPQLDRLAKSGVRFRNMHCQYPVCGASRASLMAGLYPYSTKTLGNAGTLRGNMPNVVTMSQLFRNNGYHAGRVSKIYHMRIPMEIVDGTAECDDPHSWDETVNITAPEQNAPGEKTNWSPNDKGSQAFVGVIAEGDDLVHADGKAAEAGVDFLKEHHKTPFFLAVGFVRPHVPLVAPAAYFDAYDRDAMVAPVVPENDLDDVPGIIRKYKSNEHTYGVSPENHKGLLQAYYASISYMDAQVGKLLDAVDTLGLSDNTIVVFSSDHGYLLGEHHKFQKQHLFEESTRVPFIVRVPWLKDTQGKSTWKLTELIDLYPTLADLAGLTPPGTLQGQSLVPLLEDTTSAAWKKNAVFTISRNGGESIRTHKWRYIHWGHGEQGAELYDRKKDPREHTNLVDDPAYKADVERLKKWLLAKRKAAGFRKP